MAARAAKSLRRWALLAGAAALVALPVSVAFKAPSHDRHWKAEHGLLPRAEFDGDLVTIKNVRNFSFNPDGSVRTAAYDERSYDVATLTGLWYGIARFGGLGLAHTFVSFGFEGGEYVAISIEARQEAGEWWDPLRGLLRSYELIYVVGDERDIIGRRTHIRGEPVSLYRIDAGPEAIRSYFRTMLARMNELAGEPEFYNTLTDNCTSGLLRATGRLSLLKTLPDYRLLLPGYSDEVAYELGAISNRLPLDELRDLARIRRDGVSLDDPGFSRKIRARWLRLGAAKTSRREAAEP
jgi:hypothetical protein